jgi:hypothetical protein
MRIGLVGLVLVLIAAPVARAGGDRPADEVRPRVEHHLREASVLADHFDVLLHQDCPRFSSASEWQSYVDSEMDRVVMLVAHMEQAWVEAKTTGDDDVRREVKQQRRRVNEARSLVDKWQGCAQNNGASLDTGSLWRRIERELPRRQAEIALPQ